MDKEGTALNELITDEDSEKDRVHGRFAIPLKTRRNLKRKLDDGHLKEDRAFAFLDLASKELLSKDENTVFGQLVASQIRKLNPRNQAIARNRIQNILFELEIGEMDGSSSSQFPQYVTVDDAVIVGSSPSETSTNHVCEIINIPSTSTNTVKEFLSFNIQSDTSKK